MKKRRVSLIVIGIVILCLFAWRLCAIKSYDFSLLVNGFQSPEVMYCGINDNGDEYKIVRDWQSGKMKLCHCEKGLFGFWKIVDIEQTDPGKNGIVSLEWATWKEIRRFHFEDDPKFVYEVHAVYCGNNAVKNLGGIERLVGPNITVSIAQSGSEYFLHFTSYSDDMTILTKFGVTQLLQKNGYIS